MTSVRPIRASSSASRRSPASEVTLPPLKSSEISFERRHYLVMELIEGGALEALINAGGGLLTHQEVMAVAIQLLKILEYLHSRRPPVIFRDLKPSNIMLTPRGEIKLIDFGIARYFHPGKVKDTFAMGTPGFSPPEQYGYGQSDARSDIFSWGATIYFLLTNADMAQFNMRYPPVRELSAKDKALLFCLPTSLPEKSPQCRNFLPDSPHSRVFCL